MPSPFLLPGVLCRRDPEGEAIPLVLDSPHSGTEYPEDFGHVAPMALLRTAEDTHVDALFGAAPAHGAGLLAALFPRSYIDANRSLADIDQALLAEPWPGPLAPTRKSGQGLGLVRRLALPNVPVYDRRLPVAEVRARIDRFYRPYHAELAAMLDAAHRRHGAVWHLDCHSMKSVGNAMNDDPGAVRPDFVLGDRDGTSCEPGLTRFVAETLTGLGYTVAVNDPYKGVELTARYSDPARGRHSLQIEINRRLYMDEASFGRSDGFARLQADLTRLIEALAGFVRARADA